MEFSAFTQISDAEFNRFKQLIFDVAGIYLPPTKKMLVAGRLNKRVRHYGLRTFDEYFRIVTDSARQDELQIMVDLLTTNETHFFREPDHFTYLEQRVLPAVPAGTVFRAWSAACSSGEEAYSIAMVCMEKLGDFRKWEVLGSDISTRMLTMARTGHYSMDTAKIMPKEYLAKYCLKGVRSQAGTFLVDKPLRNRVRFEQINLNQELRGVGQFDIIFLRNILIYFNTETKQKIVRRILSVLRPGGHCFIGHAESLMGLTDPGIRDTVELMAPTIYRKRQGGLL